MREAIKICSTLLLVCTCLVYMPLATKQMQDYNTSASLLREAMFGDNNPDAGTPKSISLASFGATFADGSIHREPTPTERSIYYLNRRHLAITASASSLIRKNDKDTSPNELMP